MVDVLPNPQSTPQPLALSRFGYWSSLATASCTLITFAIAIATPPLSGPLCRFGCVGYPYAEIGPRFPRDYFWLYPAIPATLLAAAFSIALYNRASPRRRPIAQVGVAFATIAAGVLVLNYFVQLAVVQPSLLAGEMDGISLLTQYNPHGLFIAMEELGFLLMSTSLACSAVAQPQSSQLERGVRSICLGGAGLNAACLLWFTLQYGHAREYRLEIAAISVAWTVLIAAGFMMAIVFRRELKG